MSRETDSRDPDSDAALRELFARAAPRPAPPTADEAEIRSAIYAEWDAATGRRVLLRRASLGVAAAALVASVVVLVVGTATGPQPAVATVERVQGDVEIAGMSAPQVGSVVSAEARVATHGGRLALRLADGGSLRLAAQTELTLTASNQAELHTGALYFDSEQDAAGSRFAIRTAFGMLRDMGTQFSAQLHADRLEIGVREGYVALARGTEDVAAAAGERVTVPRAAGGVRREPLPSFGDDWAWAERLAPPFEIDGRHPIEFLQWVAAQTGRSLVFSTPAAERIARESVLVGSIDLEPLPKLAAVLTLTDLDYVIDGESIVISEK
jgi:ferric-dicitrate binding protein FerR (iron transport regulator)